MTWPTGTSSARPATTLLRQAASSPRSVRAVASRCSCTTTPWLARHDRAALGLWRYRAVFRCAMVRQPVSLGEGAHAAHRVAGARARDRCRRLWIKDEAQNPTASFKARGMSAAVTRAKGAACRDWSFRRREMRVRRLPRTAPRRVCPFACSRRAPRRADSRHDRSAWRHAGSHRRAHRRRGQTCAIAFAAESGYFDVSTLREPYRIEGKKTMGFELAEQLGLAAADVMCIRPVAAKAPIGIWKVFGELHGGWLSRSRATSVRCSAGSRVRAHCARIREGAA